MPEIRERGCKCGPRTGIPSSSKDTVMLQPLTYPCLPLFDAVCRRAAAVPPGGKIRLLFLDFDGVLNTHDAYWQQRRQGEASGAARHIPLAGLDVDSWRLPLADNLACLNHLLDISGAFVVLSSTWRKLYSLDDMNRLFAYFGLRHPILAYTPYAPALGRGKEIKAVVDSCLALDSFVILDDDIEDLSPFLQNVVQTDKHYGLTAREVAAALNIFHDDDFTILARE